MGKAQRAHQTLVCLIIPPLSITVSLRKKTISNKAINMQLTLDFSLKLILSIIFIILFYKYLKDLIYYQSGRIAIYLGLTHYYTYEMSKGVIELPIIVIAHGLFCLFLIKMTGLNLTTLGLVPIPAFSLLAYGLLLGLGVMGTSALIGRFYIEFLRYFFKKKYPQDLRNWLAMARSGWIRHYFHTLEVLPIPLALFITLGQVCAEEIVFRGVVINVFLNDGKYIALTISVILFMCMQVFHMPNRVSAVFPMIGALVMGLVGGFLYLHIHTLIPLIIAHITFFAVAVL